MKKLALVTLVAATAASSFAQGFLEWGNSFTGVARNPIYAPDSAQPGTSFSGQSALGVPTGSTVYSGALLQGTGFTFAVYAGPSSAVDSSALSLLVSTTFRTAAGNALPAGLVLGGTVTVPGVAPGNQAKFQIRVWDNQGGTITSYANAATRAASAMVSSAALGGVDSGGNPVATPQTVGWSSFSVSSVPEPGTFVLAGLGAAGLLIFRRRK